MNEFEEMEQILEELEGMGIGLELFAILLGIGMVFLLIYGIFAIVSYIFQSIGLYTIAQRRGIQNPWLAWIPYAGPYWISGSLSDQYRYVTKGQVRNTRIILLILAAATVAVNLVIQGISGSSMEAMMDMLLSGEMGEIPGETGALVGVNAGIVGLLSLLRNVAGIVLFVFWQISLYDLYNSCNPKNAVLFLVLGIIFGFTVPFFLFACRKRDEGMPPRKQEPAVQPEQNTYPEETWEIIE